THGVQQTRHQHAREEDHGSIAGVDSSQVTVHGQATTNGTHDEYWWASNADSQHTGKGYRHQCNQFRNNENQKDSVTIHANNVGGERQCPHSKHNVHGVDHRSNSNASNRRLVVTQVIASGDAAPATASLFSRNAGGSSSPRRMRKATKTTAADSQNGTRQPH